MPRPSRRLSALFFLVSLLAPAGVAVAQPQAGSPARLPPFLDEIRRSSAEWDRRSGPARTVVDQVCLVPDLPTFLEAIATWDDRHYFPILIDDIELTFKFLRAFRPARIVRFPRKASPVPAEALWQRAQAAVARAWADDTKGDAGDSADVVPRSLGATPPGVVLSAPDSPMLAGAVALAAGRFQPLLRWDVPRKFGDVLSAEEADELAASLERTVGGKLPRYDSLGDDCDFITLASDAPYRYNPRPAPSRRATGGPDAFDDLIARGSDPRARWAYSGRLLGDATASVYRAMCSLFLQPESALLLNTYDERAPGWSDYAMTNASQRVRRLLPVTLRSGERSSLAGWHRAFDPVNRFGLVMINSHGESTRFNVTGSTAVTGDVPQTEPAVVLMIHSHSAADPTDTSTIAGRWLANGAFIYFGSMNEPYLQSFRTPDLVSVLMELRLPLGAAMRQSRYEVHGDPWRLVYLGDPLYRVEPKGQAERLPAERFPAATGWPRYSAQPRPDASATDDARLNWAVKTALAQLERRPAGAPRVEIADVMVTIRRPRLEAGLRPFYDALLADAMLQANRPGALRTQLAAVPPPERSAFLRRQLETCQLMMLEQFIATRDFVKAQVLWSEFVRFGATRDVLELVTGRLSPLADSPRRRMEWRSLLLATENVLKDSPNLGVIVAERKRVEAQR